MRTKLLVAAVVVGGAAAFGLAAAAIWTIAVRADLPYPWTAVTVLAAGALLAFAGAGAAVALLQLRALRAQISMLRRQKDQLNRIAAGERERFEKLRGGIRRLGSNTNRMLERELDTQAREVAVAMQELATQLSGLDQALATALLEEVIRAQAETTAARETIIAALSDRGPIPPAAPSQ